MIEPSSTLPVTADFDRRAYLRSIAFWRPSDLSIHTGSLGDDYRGNLQCSEQVIFGLLLCHSVSPAFDTTAGTWTKGEGKCVSGERDPVTKLPVLRHVAYNSRQPIVLTLWDRGNGIVPWITDGRQRGRSSEGMGQKEAVGEMGAVEAINHRLKMIVELARELDPPAIDGATDHKYLPANELQIRVRNEAKMRSQKALAGDKAFKGWEWAKSGEIALYLGGKLGDEKSSQWQHGLIDWRSMSDGGPVAAEFVCWTVFEPDDRDPATVETLIGSVVLRQAQVGDPPSVECKRTAAIVNKPDDPKFPGQGVPISVMARLFGVSRVTIQDRCMLLLLIPEVLDELLRAGVDVVRLNLSHGTVESHVERLHADGLQDEIVFVHDLWLPPDFVPANQDGEAFDHRCLDLGDVAPLLAQRSGPEALTIDASLVALDCLVRHGVLPGSWHLGGVLRIGRSAHRLPLHFGQDRKSVV